MFHIRVILFVSLKTWLLLLNFYCLVKYIIYGPCQNFITDNLNL